MFVCFFCVCVTDASTKIGAAPKVDIETLKRRSERFGESNSEALRKAELEEKIRKRQERWGGPEAELPRHYIQPCLESIFPT